MKILVADDDQLILKTLEHKLGKDGYEVIACKDGREAIEKISENKVDLIITDIMMPFASGLEILNSIRHSENADTPVVILSGLGQENVVLEGFNLGADDYIVKPFSPNELSVRVKRILENSKRKPS